MKLKRIAAWIGIVTGLSAAMPVAGGVGAALWQKLAPASLRAVVLTAAELTDPSRVDRVIESKEIAEGGTASGRG